MLNKDDFIRFILEDTQRGESPAPSKSKAKQADPEDALGEFDFESEAEEEEVSETSDTSFARLLLEKSLSADAQAIGTEDVILGDDPARKYLPAKLYYWGKGEKRPYQTLLFELDLSSSELLKAPLFRQTKGVLEDALTRLVQDTLKGFEQGGEGRSADTKSGQQDETLCVVSIRDDRSKEYGAAHLVCLGTVAKQERSLETFHIREEARFWEPQLAQDHLERLYDRHFRKLGSEKWQDAFITGEERKLARKLMDVCQGEKRTEGKIQGAVVDLLEQIALSYGLRKKPGGRRLEATDLPQDHDIGVAEAIVAEEKENPFQGMSLRDEKNRLLGYIIYCLDEKEDAELLREHLKANNRFHNVLVVYPNGESTGLELWQGQKPLEGKLTKRGATFEGEGEVVNLLSRFFVVSKALVSNPVQLAEELAYRARYLRGFALRELEKPKAERDEDLAKLYQAFHDVFLKSEEEDEAKQHDEFADSYAQTLTYGLLSARWIGKEELNESGERFTLENATGLLERTSPFFKDLFSQVISRSREAERDWLLQDITDLLDRIDIDAVFTAVEDDVLLGHDPVMHFYEPFLEAYDSAIKRQRGVFYTPHPVVSYIVRSVHELLQTEFGLEDGLADTTTWGEMVERHSDLELPPLTDEEGETKTISPGEPFVQILDPATGTATFPVEVIDVIYRTLIGKWEKEGKSEKEVEKAWNAYVPEHLLPRLYGYELMMAPYAIAHLKIGLKLAETGYKFASKQRSNVYLTNALESAHDFSGRLAFDAPALAHEAAAVNEIKRHNRFTVVIGNPPYSNFGMLNKNPFILSLLEDYKRGLDEKKINLDDDFIKFMRFSQATLATSGGGVLGFITNNVYLDGMTHRRMRQSLLEAFPSAWLLDLHGSAKKLETARDSGKEENVFDIQQGVSVGLFARSPASTKSVAVHSDVWGTRESKYRALNSESSTTTAWSVLKPTSPHFFFVPKDFSGGAEYESFPSLAEAFSAFQNGLKTDRDNLFFDFDRDELEQRIRKFYGKKYDAKFVEQFGIHASSSYDIEARRDQTRFAPTKIHQCLYRPFDFRWLYYDPDLTSRPASKVMRHQLAGKNIALVCLRQTRRSEEGTFFVSQNLINKDAVSLFDIGTVFPLFLYDETLAFGVDQKEIGFDHDQSKRPNLAQSFLKTVATTLQLPQKGTLGLPAGLTPEDIFHYAYAVFHSPGYRSRYAEFLKIDFPRLPLTGNLELFRALARLGGELTALHLLESKSLNKARTKLVGKCRIVAKAGWTPDNDGTVWLDGKGTKGKYQPGTSGFCPVPEEVWNFHIGGYQVCEKWLKDRQAKGGKNPRPGRTLTDDDILHYRKIVTAISETIRLMAEIDEVIEAHGGWPGAFQTEAHSEEADS